MCGRLAQTWDALDRLLAGSGGVLLDDPRPRYNVSPMQTLLSIAPNDALSDPNGPGAIAPVGSRYSLTVFQWGLVPSWARDTKMAANAINARGETIAEKPSFKAAFNREHIDDLLASHTIDTLLTEEGAAVLLYRRWESKENAPVFQNCFNCSYPYAKEWRTRSFT